MNIARGLLSNSFNVPLSLKALNIKCLGIVKRQRKPKQKFIITLFPDKKRGDDQFFFQSPPKPSLSTCLQA
jgi:hypothetical protein